MEKVKDNKVVICDGTPRERIWSYAILMAGTLELRKEYYNAAWLEESRN